MWDFRGALFLLAIMAAPIAAGADEADQVKDAVREQLRDPSSAEFGEIKSVTEASGQHVACGTVNARNGYGGYAGRMPFVARSTSDGRFFVMIGDSDMTAQTARRVCSELGISP